MTPMQEEWRSVLGYEGYYEVSDWGRVRTVARRSCHGRPVRGRLRRLTPQADGRHVLHLFRDGASRLRRVSHLVLEAFVEPWPDGKVACHDDNDPSNNRLDNLRWDTQSSNMHDKRRHGTNTMANRTRCPRNHLLAPPNLVAATARRGRRDCRACSQARASQQFACRRGDPFDFVPEADAKYAHIMGGTVPF